LLTPLEVLQKVFQILLITTQDGWWNNFEASEFLYKQIPLLKGIQRPQKSPQTPKNTLSDELLICGFENFGLAPQNITVLRSVF